MVSIHNCSVLGGNAVCATVVPFTKEIINWVVYVNLSVYFSTRYDDIFGNCFKAVVLKVSLHRYRGIVLQNLW